MNPEFEIRSIPVKKEEEMINRLTYADHQPVSIMPVAGWCAVYLSTVRIDGDLGWYSIPLVGMAVCHVTHRPCVGSTAKARDDGNELHGVIHDEYFRCAEEVTGEFWLYLGPGDKQPTEADVQHERLIRGLNTLPDSAA